MIKSHLNRIIFTVLLLSFIFIGETILHLLHLPTWPAFFIMLFFFLNHENRQEAPRIVLGALVGIGCFVIARPLVVALIPFFDPTTGRSLFVLVIVAIIIWFKDEIPVVINDYTFAYFLVSGVASRWSDYSVFDPYVWMAVTLVSGPIVIFGIIGIRKIVVIIATKRARSAAISAARAAASEDKAEEAKYLERTDYIAASNNGGLTGEWNLSVVLPSGTGKPSFTLKQNVDIIAGVYKGNFGELPVKGTIKGSDFVMSYTIKGTDITLSGKVDGDRMEGKADYGKNRVGTFTGQKK